MQADPVVEEIRQIRQEYARQFNFDLRAMVEDLRKRQSGHTERLVSYKPKPARRRKTA
jgi:hypothetical protein